MYQIILCEKATGIVLELDGKTRFLNNETKAYPSLVFNTIEEAEDKAKLLVKENSELEIGIYDSNFKFIKRYK